MRIKVVDLNLFTAFVFALSTAFCFGAITFGAIAGITVMPAFGVLGVVFALLSVGYGLMWWANTSKVWDASLVETGKAQGMATFVNPSGGIPATEWSGPQLMVAAPVHRVPKILERIGNAITGP